MTKNSITKTVSIIHPYRPMRANSVSFASLHMTARNPYGRTSFGALIQKYSDFMDEHYLVGCRLEF